MAYTTIDNPHKFFNTVLYTGNASTRSITGVGFQPDWVWTKSRGNINNHNMYDVVRGATKRIFPNSTAVETTTSNTLTSFDSDGFSLGDQDNVNANGITMAAWNWKAGNSSGSSNGDGSITSTVSVNTTAGFSIVSYTGTGSNATVGHGLGAVPKMIITKGRSFSDDWLTYHESIGNGKYIILNKTDAEASSSLPWNSTTPTSSVFSIGSSGTTNNNGGTIIAYCFAEVKGYSKFGSYTGNGNADGTFIYTGFKPAFVIGKRSSATEDWYLFDTTRDDRNVMFRLLYPNADYAEYTAATRMDFLSNGFKQYNTDNKFNGSGSTYIYMAFAEHPFVTEGTKAAGTAR